jgi:hypothetical protein
VKRKDLPRAAIFDAILRCERLGNTAVVERESYAVHVRKLPVADGRGWVVRVIDKSSVIEHHGENSNDKSDA